MSFGGKEKIASKFLTQKICLTLSIRPVFKEPEIEKEKGWQDILGRALRRPGNQTTVKCKYELKVIN